ncbi:MAG: hypothetical protein NT154_23715 [Verrucomicrobia bacterium]|nr:hypothetical protein [Verrucomicrobiota bacterium]
MNENNSPSQTSGQRAALADVPGSVINRRLMRMPRRPTIIPEGVRPKAQPTAPSPVQPVDKNLDETDFKITMVVTVSGRSAPSLAKLEFVKTCFGGLTDNNRTVFSGKLQQLLMDVQWSVTSRVTEIQRKHNPDWAEEDIRPVTRSMEDFSPAPLPGEFPEQMKIHVDPELGFDPSAWR